MISKVLKAHSFYHTARYICEKPGAEVLIAEGVRGHDYKLMAEDFLNQQQLRPGKEKAVMHAILSFDPGDKLTDELMKEIALKYLARLGVENTQFSITKHTDREHPHLHIIANMVNNEGKAVSDSWIGLKGKKISQQLTQEFKLIPALKKNLKQTHLERLNNAEAEKYRIYQAIAENLPHCKTLQDLEERLRKLNIETQYKYKGQTQEKQGISFKVGNLCFKGSQVDRRYSLNGLQKAMELAQRQEQKQQPRQTIKQEKLSMPAQQRRTSLRRSNREDSEEAGMEAAPVIGKEMSNILMNLLKPEPGGGGGGDSVPYELSQEAELRRLRKKKSVTICNTLLTK